MCVIGSLICNQNDKLCRIDDPIFAVLLINFADVTIQLSFPSELLCTSPRWLLTESLLISYRNNFKWAMWFQALRENSTSLAKTDRLLLMHHAFVVAYIYIFSDGTELECTSPNICLTSMCEAVKVITISYCISTIKHQSYYITQNLPVVSTFALVALISTAVAAKLKNT